jgi:hypothetical protein
MAFFLNLFGFFSISSYEGPSRAGHFLLPPFAIPGILAMLFPHTHATAMHVALPWRTRQRERGGVKSRSEEGE